MVGVVKMPEKILKKLNERILPQWKVCFLSALVIGLLAHLYKITGWLPNWDSLVFRYDPQNMLGLGRWFLPVVCSFSSFYDLPFLNGIISILFHALGAVCICKILKVENKITAALIGALIVSFPTVTSVLMYNYVADGYSIAFFMSTLAAVFMTNKKPNYIAAALLIALSSGIYQAYLTVTVMLILLHLIDELVFGNEKIAFLWKKTAFMLLTGIAGVAMYAIVLKILLGAFSVELLDYQGAKGTASLSNFDILASLYIIKETFVKCFFDISNGINFYVAINAAVVAITAICYAAHIIKNKLYKNPLRIITTILFGAMLVCGAGVLAFINPYVDYHNLMRMGYAVFYLFFIIIYERGACGKESHNAVKCWTVLLTAVLIIANQVVIANVSYHKAQMAYEKSYGVLIRIVDRIEQTPGAEECESILVIGALDNSEAYGVNLTPDITGITDGLIIRADDEVVGQSVFCSALNDYCDKDYAFVSGEEKDRLAATDAAKALESWPSKNCVTIVDNTIIIKLGTEVN